MADELKTESTFAQEQPELSESDRIRERIQNFTVGITPEAAQANASILENSLRKGVFGLGDLGAVEALNKQLVEGLSDYQNQVTMAQRRLQELATDEALAKQTELARREDAWKVKIADERQLRKSLQDRVVTLEAQLATAGQAPLATIHADDEEGVVKVEETNIAEAPVVEEPKVEEPKTRSKAWDVVRAINPDTRSTSEELQDDLEPIPEVDEIILDNEFGADEVEERKEQLVDHVSGVSEEDFASVDPINEFTAQTDDSIVGWDANGSPVYETDGDMDFSGAFETDVEETEETFAETAIEPSRPFVTSSNAPSNIQSTEHDESDDIEDAKQVEAMVDDGGPVTNGDTITAPVELPDTVRTSLGKVKMIQETPEEDEYEEISIPSASELDRLTKKQIKAEADKLGFSANVKHSKPKMIESFTSQTEKFISELQDSGDFVSASDTEDEGDKDEDTVRDGGFF